jgi:enoyl-CoA hydratase/carnithine racemase
MRYALTGDTFDAPAALRMQLVAQVIPREEAETVALALALRISKGAPLALRAAIGHARAWAEGGEVAGFARSIPDMLDLLQSSDVAEAMQAMQENRAPKFTGR